MMVVMLTLIVHSAYTLAGSFVEKPCVPHGTVVPTHTGRSLPAVDLDASSQYYVGTGDSNRPF